MKKYSKILIVILVFISTFFTSCVTTISAIKENPQKFAGKTLDIKGTVTNVINVPFTEFQVFLFADDNSKTAVFSISNHKKEETFILSGLVVTFPENATNDTADAAAKSLSDYIIKMDLAKPDKVKKIAGIILGVIRTISKGLGGEFFIIEQ